MCVYVYIECFSARWSKNKLNDKKKTITDTTCIMHVCEYVRASLKLFAFELTGKILEARRKSRSTTFVQRVKRDSQTAKNGGFIHAHVYAYLVQ
jgi:hypothetical protein